METQAQNTTANGQMQANPQNGNTAFPKDTYLYWYEQMLLMRKFEEKAGQLYGQQKIRGFCHLYIGQEAVVAGMLSAIQKGDKVITAYRDHAHAIGMGIPPKEVMAELYGKSTGCTKGKGGSMHMFSKEHNFYGGHGIVGAQIPLGAGIAFAEKYKGTNNICLCFMGDGAVRQGALHEAFNMAMLWKLPVVFICENNQYGMGTAVQRTTNVPDLYKIGLSFEMPSFQVNGMECEAVHAAISDAAASARQGVPVFLEIKTYRYKGHSMSDPAKYRSREEVDEYRAKDPIDHVLHTIQQNGFADENWINELNEKIKQEVEEAVQFAEESPFPDPSEIYTDNYVESDYPFLED
jgi:pyruvate dehydrogenase E1 component alpha subunit